MIDARRRHRQKFRSHRDRGNLKNGIEANPARPDFLSQITHLKSHIQIQSSNITISQLVPTLRTTNPSTQSLVTVGCCHVTFCVSHCGRESHESYVVCPRFLWRLLNPKLLFLAIDSTDPGSGAHLQNCAKQQQSHRTVTHYDEASKLRQSQIGNLRF